MKLFPEPSPVKPAGRFPEVDHDKSLPETASIVRADAAVPSVKSQSCDDIDRTGAITGEPFMFRVTLMVISSSESPPVNVVQSKTYNLPPVL